MYKIKVIMQIILSLGLLTVLSCLPKADLTRIQGTSIPSPVALPEIQKWEREWELILKKGQAEGTLSLGSSGGGQYKDFKDTFFKRYGITIEHQIIRGEGIYSKMSAERKAGIYTVDVYFGGTATIVNLMKPAGFLDPLEPALLLPEVIDPKVWDRGKLDWLDPEHLILAFFSYPQPPIVINTDLVKAEEIKSYRDLLKPKWKGQIVLDDPTIGGSGSKLIGVLGNLIMDWDYIKELAKQDPVISRDKRLHVEWIARGKYPIAMATDVAQVTEFLNVGAPISYVVPIEGTYRSSGIGDLVLINKAPHPNAARVFINWLLSREGQTIISKASGYQSGRIDVPTDFLNPSVVRDPKTKYIFAYDEAYSLKEPGIMERAKEIFQQAMK